MNKRFYEMQALLSRSVFFKLVCGAGNEEAEEVRRLSLIYTLAGCHGLDVSASPEIVTACVAGIEKAYELAPQFARTIATRPFITVSVGMKGDHHVRKAFITDACVKCGKCIPVCPTEAITSDFVVTREKCIGCGNCDAICPPKISAVEFGHDRKELDKILPSCLEAGAENIELHAAVSDDDSIIAEWQTINRACDRHYVSMCLDRFHLSNLHLIERIRRAGEISRERLIIQADGIPMSGGCDDFNTTLQAIAIADLIHKDLIKKDSKFRNLHILISGGTNGQTAELARLCDVPFSGISIGTHARKIVKEYITCAGDFDSNIGQIKEAVKVAEELVTRSISK
ncbi:4Fe-4S binding protein [Candidatus Riflebacteria bacterium]